MFIITALGDEISPDVDRQIELLESLGINHIEFRGAKCQPVTALRKSQLNAIKHRLDAHGFRVSAVASPIGKIRIDDPFEEHVEEFSRVLDAAEMLGTRYVRVFSFYPDASGNLLNRRDEVLERMTLLVEKARVRGLVLLLENEKRVYGESPERCHDLLTTIHSPHLRATFDFGNFVEVCVNPLTQAYPLLKEFIEHVHVKDAQRLPDGTCRIVPAGQGDGQVDGVLADLANVERKIFLSVEPRGAVAGLSGGEPDPRRCTQSILALRDILVKLAATAPPCSVTSAVTQPVP